MSKIRTKSPKTRSRRVKTTKTRSRRARTPKVRSRRVRTRSARKVRSRRVKSPKVKSPKTRSRRSKTPKVRAPRKVRSRRAKTPKVKTRSRRAKTTKVKTPHKVRSRRAKTRSRTVSTTRKIRTAPKVRSPNFIRRVFSPSAYIPPPPSSSSELQNAINLRSIYYSGYEFPQWVVDPALWNSWKFSETIVFYEKGYNLADINKLVIQREPVNIGMRRYYDQDKMLSTFGWRTSSNERKPNIAIYCNAHINWKNLILDNVHVINLIGFSLERGQPDRAFFVDANGQLNYDRLIPAYNKMWQKLVACAMILKIKSVRIFAVGGGAFAGEFFNEYSFIKNVLTPSFLPCFRDLNNAGITVAGCNYVDGTFKLEPYWIPNNLFEDPDVHTTLYVNAWDPWSIIGNGNGNDNSLDGYWGRCSNMSVLGWGLSNKHMKFQQV